jgi:hypothetical protein
VAAKLRLDETVIDPLIANAEKLLSSEAGTLSSQIKSLGWFREIALCVTCVVSHYNSAGDGSADRDLCAQFPERYKYERRNEEI